MVAGILQSITSLKSVYKTYFTDNKQISVVNEIWYDKLNLTPEDTTYDVELCNWVYQIVYTRSFETDDGDVKIVPMGDVSYAPCLYYIDWSSITFQHNIYLTHPYC